LKEALTGFKTELKHVGTHMVDIDRSGMITKPGFVQTFVGEGMPKTDDNSDKGDLHVTFEVDFPEVLTA
jgi:DnaJ family protein B protein 11